MSMSDSDFRKKLLGLHQRRYDLQNENRQLDWKWQEYIKLSQNRRERGAHYDHGRWQSGWQEGCEHMNSACNVTRYSETYDPNNPDHKYLKKYTKQASHYYVDGKKIPIPAEMYVNRMKSNNPEKQPIHLPYEKHPNRAVQAKKDRQREIGQLIEAGKVQEAEMIKLFNEEQMVKAQAIHTAAVAKEKQRVLKAKHKGHHPEHGTTSSPSRRTGRGTIKRRSPVMARRR